MVRWLVTFRETNDRMDKMLHSNESADLRHLVTPGDVITEDTGFMRYCYLQIMLAMMMINDHD